MSGEKTTKKIRLDTSYSAQQRSERCEIRCSKNFNTVMTAIIDNCPSYNKLSKADVLHKAIKLLAEKEGLLSVGDSTYI